MPQAGRLANSLLLAIEGRGRDATGLMALLPNGKVQVGRRTVPARRFIGTRRAFDSNFRTLLLHTRFATVGSPTDPRNAHPVVSGRCAAIHNGTIYNHRELFDAFGLKRHATVDSEVIPALIDYAGWEQAAAAIDLMDGGAAMAVVSTEHPDELLLARTRSYPLVYYATRDVVVWASTRDAIERAWTFTYGRVPRVGGRGGGKFVTVPEWTLVRVNGTLETTTIRKVPKKPAAKKIRMSGSRYRPRREKMRQLELPHDAPEPYMDDAVDALMREGLTYEDAFDEVYGVAPADPVMWVGDDLYSPDDSSWGSAWQRGEYGRRP